MKFIVGDHVTSAKRLATEPRLFGVVTEVVDTKHTHLWVRWDQDRNGRIPVVLQSETIERGDELTPESREEEEHMRKFTQEEQDYILKILADPAHDSYVVGPIVKDAKENTAKAKRYTDLQKAARLVETAIQSLDKSVVVRYHDRPMGCGLFEAGEEQIIQMEMGYGTYWITIAEKES